MTLFIRLLNIESGSVCKQCSHGDYTPLNKINVPKKLLIKYQVHGSIRKLKRFRSCQHEKFIKHCLCLRYIKLNFIKYETLVMDDILT